MPEYRDIPEEDRKKAKVFFDRGKTVADTGNYEYAIEMYLQGLAIDPEAIDAHEALRAISLRRKASGGKDLGMFEKMKLKGNGKDDKLNMLNAEKMLSYDPGNTDNMVRMMQSAHKAGYFESAVWMGPILLKANQDSGKEDFAKYIILKDIYRDLGYWKEAVEACQNAVRMKPDDMDLNTELKNLGAQHTMSEGKYGSAKTFRDSMRDKAGQEKLLDMDKGVYSDDAMARHIKAAEQEWLADPREFGKLLKYVDMLAKTENFEHENRAIEILEETYASSKQYKFRYRSSQIKLGQLSRMERSMRQQLAKSPNDEAMKKDYREFVADKAQQELTIFQEAAENYPTDMTLKFQVAQRLYLLGRFVEAIPAFQQSRSDPKNRTDATLFLGRAFLDAQYVDEAVDTLRVLIEEYPLKGDPKSVEMTYWYARALEAHNQNQLAIKNYSQVAQWDFNYRDVQTRIKRLRAAAAAG